jgi:hypothetical protein
VTGGAATGLVVGAVMGLASATLQTANTEAKKAGTLPKDAMGNQNEISFTGMAQAIQDGLVSSGNIIRVDSDGNAIDAKGNKMTAEQVKAAVKNGAMVRKEDDLSKDVMAIGMVLEVAYALAAMACGIGGAKNVENYITKGKDIIAKAVGPTLDRASAVADTVEAAGDAATAGAETKFNVDIAEADKAGAVADAFAKFYEKEAKKIAFDMQVSQDVLQHLIDALNDIFSGASESISEYGQAGTTIAQNMVAGAQA